MCDFGLSHTMEDAAATKATSLGSPQWTAPEVLRAAPYGATADTFSYGILLFEVMARRLRALLCAVHAWPTRAAERAATGCDHRAGSMRC